MKLHQLEGYIQAVYLAEYPHGLLLLDGCCRADVRLLVDFITQKLQRPLSDLKVIVVTHMHPDHAGAAHKMQQLSGAQIASTAKDNHWYRGINGVLMHWIDVVLTWYVGRKMGRRLRYVGYPRKLASDIKLCDGDLIPGFEDWQALETPGHTDRDLSLWHPQKKCVYVADLIIKLKTKFIAPYYIFYPNQYQRSLQKVEQLQAHKTLLAHGGEVELQAQDFRELMTQSPRIPRTPLRASWRKLKKIVGA